MIIRRRAQTADPRFFPSGSTLLDCILGGGWARNRTINIVGDKAVGKTLIAIEACANFARSFPKGKIRYNEAESAFDRGYSASIGMPASAVFVGDDLDVPMGSETVEAFHDDVAAFVDKDNTSEKLYVLDSLDALSDEAEMGRETGKASYGTGKAKGVSEFFRKQNSRMVGANCSLIIVSQIRDNIGVTFGETKKRSGGRALDFYASQIVWLSQIGKIERTISGEKVVVGTYVRVLCKKNKLGVAYKQADLHLHFNYGIDDEMSMISWLEDHNKQGQAQLGMSLTEFRQEIKKARSNQDRESADILAQELRRATRERWTQIEDASKPALSKYT